MASGAAEKNQLVQFVILLHMIGEESLDIYITFTFSQDEVNEIQPLIQKFERKIYITYQRERLLRDSELMWNKAANMLIALKMSRI